MEDVLAGFNAEYKVDSGQNYLVLDKPGLVRGQIIEFQAEMAANNKIPGIVDFHLREKNSEIKLYYCLNGLVSLDNYLKKKQAGKTEFIKLLERMVSVILEGPNYFLNAECFLLNEQYIYISPASGEVSLIYIPVEFRSGPAWDQSEAFRTFLVNFLINNSTVETADNSVHRLLKLLKPDEFNLPGFVRQLQQMKMTGPEGSSETCIPLQYAPVACAAAAESGEGLCPAETGSKTGSKTETPGGKSAARAKILGILACITVMGAIISNLIDGFKGLSFVPSRNTVFWLGGAVLLLVLATAGVFYVRSRSRNRDIRPAGEHAKLSRFMAGVDRHPETSVSESPVQAVSEPPVQANFQPDSPSPQNAEPQGADETVLLGGAGCPVLRSVSGDVSVAIDKPEFIIGRNRDKSDYVIDNMGIGRTHALIKNIGGSSFLVDLDSRNGTLLNETRLLCNTRYRLTNNDKIAFANVEFYFITE